MEKNFHSNSIIVSLTLSFYPQIIFISNTVLFDGNSKHFSFSIPHAAPFFHIISMEVGGEKRAKSCIKLKINFANDNKCQPVGGQYIRVLMFPLFRIIKKIKIFSGWEKREKNSFAIVQQKKFYFSFFGARKILRSSYCVLISIMHVAYMLSKKFNFTITAENI
jgi:hypothetical protein